jgi:hypothetical protein
MFELILLDMVSCYDHHKPFNQIAEGNFLEVNESKTNLEWAKFLASGDYKQTLARFYFRGYILKRCSSKISFCWWSIMYASSPKVWQLSTLIT